MFKQTKQWKSPRTKLCQDQAVFLPAPYPWLDLDGGDVGLLVNVLDGRFIGVPVLELHFQLLPPSCRAAAGHHVGIGDNQPRVRHDKARATGEGDVAAEQGVPTQGASKKSSLVAQQAETLPPPLRKWR